MKKNVLRKWKRAFHAFTSERTSVRERKRVKQCRRCDDNHLRWCLLKEGEHNSSWKLKIIWVSSSHAVSLSVTFKLLTLPLSAGCVLSFLPLSFLFYSLMMSFPFISFSDFHFLLLSFLNCHFLVTGELRGAKTERRIKKFKQERKLRKWFYGHAISAFTEFTSSRTRLNLGKKKFSEK